MTPDTLRVYSSDMTKLIIKRYLGIENGRLAYEDVTGTPVDLLPDGIYHQWMRKGQRTIANQFRLTDGIAREVDW